MSIRAHRNAGNFAGCVPGACQGECRPILFSAPMVRALLTGTKTQTRRIVKPQPTGERRPLSEWSSGLAHACHDSSPDPEKLRAHSDRLKGRIFPFADEDGDLYSPSCPYGRPGDLLWVRETWAKYGDQIEYRASPICGGDPDGGWRPSIYMSRALSRITLRITDVRIERLQDITEADAIAEGIEGSPGEWKSYEIIHEGRHKGRPHPHSVVPNRSPVTSYRELWESINGADSWAASPWVWVVAFERVQP